MESGEDESEPLNDLTPGVDKSSPPVVLGVGHHHEVGLENRWGVQKLCTYRRAPISRQGN